MKKQKGLLRLWGYVWRFFLALFLFSILIVLVFRFVPVPITPLMIQRCIEQKINNKPFRLSKHWMSLINITPNLPLAVVASEDQNYMEHNGFDVKAIEEAMKYNKNHTKHKRGASTISQQTAKNVFLLPSRSWLRKGLEVYFTFLIETLWSKERIMEVYLNVIEMGDGVYGAEAAAQYHFGTSAKKLTKPQAALIAAILPSPLKWSPTNPSAFVQWKQRWILQQMVQLGGELDYNNQ